MDFPKPKGPTGLPWLVVLEIILFIIGLIAKGMSESEAIDTISRRHGISREAARRMYRGY
jgi:hypothetical protein